MMDILIGRTTLTFSHDGGRVYPTHTRNHPAWRGTHRARRPRAHGSAEASPAQHHCTLRARSLTHSSLDAVQSGVANANHHCSSTANICTTTPFVHIARLHLPCKYWHTRLQSPRNPLPTAWPCCSAPCLTTRSPHCSALPVASCNMLRSGTLEQPYQFDAPSASALAPEYHSGIARPSPPTWRAPAGQRHHPHAARSMIKIDNVFGTCP